MTVLKELVQEEVVQATSPPPQAWEVLGQARLSAGETTQANEIFARAEEAGAVGGGAAFERALAARLGRFEDRIVAMQAARCAQNEP